jgi:biotin carboxyl carrier protein
MQGSRTQPPCSRKQLVVRVDRGATGRYQPSPRGRPTPRAGLVLLLLVAACIGMLIRNIERPSGGAVAPSGQAANNDASISQNGAVVAAAASQGLIGTAGPVTLFVPAAEAVLVSFHEAALPEAIAFVPFGKLLGNENSTRFSAPQAQSGGAPYRVQVSRGRPNAPTSAVDVVLADGEAVLSPVAGVVAEVRSYSLYGTYDDVRLELHPDEATEYAVVLIHVEGVQVRAGDRVEVGTVLADSARRFPFEAVVDRATAPVKLGHVHIEVKRREG